MKRITFLFLSCMVAICAGAATLRVNNAANTAAQFNNVKDALEAAQEGDVIIIEPSSQSYGDFEVGKKVTVKGGGYFLDVNDISYEGAAASIADNITVRAKEVTLTGLDCNSIILLPGANDVVITRNEIRSIKLGGTFGYDVTDENAISGTIIHQNFVYAISGPQYGAKATGIQVTNNIIPYSYGQDRCITSLRNSIIRNNTYGTNDDCAFRWIDNSVFEYNMGGKPEITEGEGNTYINNHQGGSYQEYGSINQMINHIPDSKYEEVDASISAEHGAFAGETPYVLSGIPSGPVIKDLTLPNSVEKGEDLKVTVVIGTQK
ncbi:MAG: hypothetical protein K2G23_08425 [Muribaculaceae bacterium]|nr:hypothetical protein [Muribaculaceae bacterium]